MRSKDARGKEIDLFKYSREKEKETRRVREEKREKLAYEES